jgi:hypothetical protein
LNLAAITAAICMGREAHEDPARRYVAAVVAGMFYIAIGLFGATVGAVFAAFPRELVLAIAGLALLGTIGTGLVTALKSESERESALVPSRDGVRRELIRNRIGVLGPGRRRASPRGVADESGQSIGARLCLFLKQGRDDKPGAQ